MALEVPAEACSIELADAPKILIAYLSNPSTVVAPDKLAGVIRDVYAACGEISGQAPQAAEPAAPQKPAVPISASYTHDYMICLEDGQRLTMLTRYLKAQHNMTPEEYRAKWNLPDDYPMVAPAYSQRRSALAKKQGLGGNKPAQKAAAPPPPVPQQEPPALIAPPSPPKAPPKSMRRKEPPKLTGRHRRAARKTA